MEWQGDYINKVICGDSLDILQSMPDEGIQCCVTSPPFWGLRDYGVVGQLGLEATPDDYVAKMVEVFREVRRVLKDDGIMFLNLGDTYAASRSYQVPDNKHPNMGDNKGAHKVPPGLKPKDLVGIPWRVAFGLQADGWYLRQDIIWAKPSPMPESVGDRCTKSHEYIFLMTKSAKYYYDAEAIKEPAAGWHDSNFHTGKTAGHQLYRAQVGNHRPGRSDGGAACNDPNQEHRNRRSVWTVATQPCAEAHFATFPPALIEPCILAGSRKCDIILDPFMGSGTTGMVAKKHSRRWIGIELNPDYCKMAARRIANTAEQPGLFDEVLSGGEINASSAIRT